MSETHAPAAISVAQLHSQALSSFRRLFASLPAAEGGLSGSFSAEFAGPGWLRRLAPRALALSGLGGWCGKEIAAAGGGLNLVWRKGELRRIFPFSLQVEPSLLDGRPAFVVHYNQGCPFPWPYIIDELRWLDENTLLGMTMARVGGLQRWPFPFLLYIN